MKGVYCDELAVFTEDFFYDADFANFRKKQLFDGHYKPGFSDALIEKKYIERKSKLNMDVWNFGLHDNEFLEKTVVESLKKRVHGRVFYDRFIFWANGQLSKA